jgi:hypothetical protein
MPTTPLIRRDLCKPLSFFLDLAFQRPRGGPLCPPELVMLPKRPPPARFAHPEDWDDDEEIPHMLVAGLPKPIVGVHEGFGTPRSALIYLSLLSTFATASNKRR